MRHTKKYRSPLDGIYGPTDKKTILEDLGYFWYCQSCGKKFPKENPPTLFRVRGEIDPRFIFKLCGPCFKVRYSPGVTSQLPTQRPLKRVLSPLEKPFVEVKTANVYKISRN